MRRIAVVSLSLLLFALALCTLSTPSSAQVAVGISVGFGPPALPVYEQPICPGDGYLWTPGYWAWDPDAGDYYWVPGTWVLAPEVGFLWTPPWWGWEGGRFLFHEGWWGPHIGFYGGINYGFGYFGVGFAGGRWDGGHFFYNRSVTNINVVNIHNVYNETVNVNVNRVSFNGGPGGIGARANAEEEAAARDRHIAAVSAQTAHVEQARGNRELRASVNQGRPPIAATGRPGEFSGHEVIAAKEAGGAYHPPAEHGGGEPKGSEPNAGRPGNNVMHAKDLPPVQHAAAPNTGNANLDKKYQQQQDKLYAKQNQERQQLQQKQEQEDQRMQKAPPQRQQQTEQRHQQQTQQIQQRHQQQAQQLQHKQAPPASHGGKR
jgi:YXWGXW repeat-containing protein